MLQASSMVVSCRKWLVVLLVVSVLPEDSSSASGKLPRKPASVRDERVFQALEASLLSALGLSSRPKPVSSTSYPPYMLELYRRQRNSKLPFNNVDSPFLQTAGRQGVAANTVRSFYHIGKL